jgi:hypothetical protein
MSVAGHSRGLHQTPLEARCGEQSLSVNADRSGTGSTAAEKLFSALSPAQAMRRALARRPVQLVRGSVEGQRPALLRTAHQEG